ncbi:mycofactocin precursor MftA [Phycicoccus sp. Soil802]|nr:mycofactocin precursor MftA [Phycicoccus sp. Soil802]
MSQHEDVNDPQQLHQDEPDQHDHLVAEDLIEEVSIDGMCGVY